MECLRQKPRLKPRRRVQPCDVLRSGAFMIFQMANLLMVEASVSSNELTMIEVKSSYCVWTAISFSIQQVFLVTRSLSLIHSEASTKDRNRLPSAAIHKPAVPANQNHQPSKPRAHRNVSCDDCLDKLWRFSSFHQHMQNVEEKGGKWRSCLLGCTHPETAGTNPATRDPDQLWQDKNTRGRENRMKMNKYIKLDQKEKNLGSCEIWVKDLPTCTCSTWNLKLDRQSRTQSFSWVCHHKRLWRPWRRQAKMLPISPATEMQELGVFQLKFVRILKFSSWNSTNLLEKLFSFLQKWSFHKDFPTLLHADTHRCHRLSCGRQDVIIMSCKDLRALPSVRVPDLAWQADSWILNMNMPSPSKNKT